MNEYYTYEAILNRMMLNVPLDIDTREGSIIYNALAPAAAELAQAYIRLFSLEDRTYADTALDEDLKRRCAERGVYPEEAAKAVRKGIFNIDVPLNSRFRGGDLIYKAIEKIALGEFKMECEIAGEIGNSYSGLLLPIEYMNGLKTAALADILVPGQDEESTESLRAKYFDSLESDSYGGNISDYKTKTNKLTGVGGTKVYPAWNGGGTVKLVIIDSDFNKPSSVLVDNVQTSIDPIQNQGKGLGIAPIGHVVTVEGVTENAISIASGITLQSGYVWQDVRSNIITVIRSYLNELNKTWAEKQTLIANDPLVVRISQIETKILDVSGILDIQNTLINGVATNLVLDVNEIAVLEDVIKI